MSQFLGITRERVFSPGRVDDDRVILELVAEELHALGQSVSVFDADETEWPQPAAGTVVFAMCQSTTAVQRLHDWQTRGLRIINRPEGILNCRRHRTIAALADTAVAYPPSLLLATAHELLAPPWLHTGAWLKRGDVHATEADDVVFVNDVGAVRAALQRFQHRGIRAAVLQQHVPGTVLKFYAVRGAFSHCVPPENRRALSPEVLERLDALGQMAARALHVEVYGGDCVYDDAGALTLIDLNDWPSYARCRVEAAKAIATYLQAQTVTT